MSFWNDKLFQPVNAKTGLHSLKYLKGFINARPDKVAKSCIFKKLSWNPRANNWKEKTVDQSVALDIFLFVLDYRFTLKCKTFGQKYSSCGVFRSRVVLGITLTWKRDFTRSREQTLANGKGHASFQRFYFSGILRKNIYIHIRHSEPLVNLFLGFYLPCMENVLKYPLSLGTKLSLLEAMPWSEFQKLQPKFVQIFNGQGQTIF